MAAVVAVAGFAVSSAPAARTAHRSAVTPLAALDVQIVQRINVERTRRGLVPLHLSGRLRAAANFHSFEMARAGFFSHASLDGTMPTARLARYYRSAGFRHWQVAETLEWHTGAGDAASVVRDWLSSASHRSILLDSGLRDIGISAVHAGAFQGAAATLVTADFGARSR
jgi:uncharacterized protein YkwD